MSKGTIVMTPAADYTDYEGYGVTMTADVATKSASASVPIKGVITVPGTVAQKCSIAIAGAAEDPVYVKLSGTVTRGDLLTQHTDGSFVVDAGSGARVGIGIALEAGVSGDLIQAQLITPRIYAS